MSQLSAQELRSARVLLFVSLCIVLLSAVAIYFTANYATWPPFKETLALEYPVYSRQAADSKGVYVIDSSSRRVVHIAEDGSLGYTIEGGSREDGQFFYAREIASAEDGSIYVLNHRLDEKGFYLTREEILHYDAQGRFIEASFAKSYEQEDYIPEIVQRGTIIDLQILEGQVHWYELGMTGITDYRLDSDGNPEALGFFPFQEAQLHVASLYRVDGQSFIGVLKDASMVYMTQNRSGRLPQGLTSQDFQPSPNLTMVLPQQARVFYRHIASDSEDSLGIIPWSAGLTPLGVSFTDLENGSIRRLHPDGSISTILDAEILSASLGEEVYPYYYYFLTIANDGTIVTTNDEGVVLIQPDGEFRFVAEARYTGEQRLLSTLFWVAVLIAAAGFVAAARGFYVGVMKAQVSKLVLRAAGLALLVLLVGGLSALIIIPNFSGRYQDVVLQKISQMLQIIPQVIDADAMEQMKSPEAYNSQSYRQIRESLMGAFNENKDDWNKGYYFALYRVVNDKLYGFMYMNGLINTYYPFDWLEGPEEPGVYDLAQAGEIATELTTDISGDWIYGVGPIYNSRGDVIGLFETGTDLYALQSENFNLVRNLILELLTLLIVIILLVVEMTFFAHLRAQRKLLGGLTPAALPEREDGFSGILFARPIAYVLFTGLSLSVAFLPILSSRLYVPVEGQAADVFIALPLAIETLGFGLATLLGGFIARALKWQGLFYSGILLAAAGLVLSGTAASLQVLTLARAIVGIGSGLGYMGLRSVINRERNEAIRSRGFSNFYAGMTAGVNTGLVIGASLADIVGLQTVFFIAAGILGFVFLLPIFIRLHQLLPVFKEEEYVSPIRGIGKLLTSPRIWVFFVGMILPTYIAGSFIVYYFPLFAESQGIGTADIGRLLILNGLCIVYFGPALSSILEKRLGNLWGSILGSVIWGLGLLVAALTGSVLGAVLALVIMGITEGFAVNTQNNVFLQFPAVKRVGTDQAVGIYELMGKLGETLGPIIFGLALLLGARFGLSVVAAIVAGLAFIVPLAAGARTLAAAKRDA